MKIAVAGKGGSGKTTIAGTLARSLARAGRPVLAIDADSNPNLGVTLGLSRDQISRLRPLDRSILDKVTDPDGKARTVLAKAPDDVVREFGVTTPEGVSLLLMGRVEHAGAG